MKNKLLLTFLLTFLLIIFFSFSISIFADSNTILSIDDILKKVDQLSRFTFNVNMYFIRFFNGSFNAYNPYLIINTAFIYNFSSFTTININYNLGQNGKIDLDNFDSNNFTSMDLNEFSIYENLAKLFNFNKIEMALKIGYFTYNSSIIEMDNPILDGGYSLFVIENPIILSQFKYEMFSFNLGNIQYNENAFGQIKFNFLNLLTMAFDFFAAKNEDFVYNFQLLFKYINFYLYANITPFQTVISSIKTYQANLNVRANYRVNDLKIGKLNLNTFSFTIYYDSLNNESFNGHMISQDFSRIGGEIIIKSKWFDIELNPFYILTSNDVDSDGTNDKFFTDGILRINFANMYFEIGSNHSIVNGMDIGYFIKMGALIN